MHFSLSFVPSVYTGTPQSGAVGEFLEYVEVAPHVGYLVILLSRKACAAEGTTLRLSVDALIIHDLEGLGIRQLLYKTQSSIK